MSLPKISLHDGKHKMIVAEDGERVLTPEENQQYEKEHPDARMEPMKAKVVYDLGGIVSSVEKGLSNQTPEQKQRAIDNMPGNYTEPVHSVPLMNQMYDKGGKVETPSITDRIKDRAVELYHQGKALASPLDTEAAAFKEKQQNVESVMPKPLQAPASTITPAVKPDYEAEYGTRPGEKKLDAEGNEIKPTTPQGMGAIGPRRPVPSALGNAYDCGGMVYDEGGKVDISQESDDPEKEAAYHQAASEVHAEEAAKHFPNPKGIQPQTDTEIKPAGEKPFGTEFDTSPGQKVDMEPYSGEEKERPVPWRPAEEGSREPVITEASAKKPFGSIAGAPQPSGMRQLPTMGTPTPEAPKPEAEATAPDIDSIIRQDKMDAAKRGHAGLADLGLAQIHENLLGKKEAPPAAGPDLVPFKPSEPTYTGTERIGRGTPGEAAAHRQFQAKVRDYDQRMQDAMDRGTPEGDLEAASLQMAKDHFLKMNPKGSAANAPGFGGKIEHVLSRVGQAALIPVAPYLAPAIPGSQANLAAKDTEAEKAKGEATKESLEQAQARQANVGSKLPPATQVFDDLKNQINPETNRVYTDQERLEIAQNPGKGAEVSYAHKYQKDHPGSTYEDGVADYHRMVAGTKPLNEKEREIADYLAQQKMEDTPQNRDNARVAIERRNTLVKQQTELPFSEAKAKFNDSLSTSRALLVQQNADANQRGLKADELQQVENARSSAVSSKLTTAKDALGATDEQFSNQIVPIVTLLSVTSAEGVKRVNKQELDKFVPTSGSFGRWITGHSDQFLSGQIPAEYRDEVGHMLDRMVAAETAEHIINTRSIDDTIRQGAQQPVQTSKGGAAAKPAPSKPQAPAAEKTAAGGGDKTSAFAQWKAKQQSQQK